jgi:hypothetical protein
MDEETMRETVCILEYVPPEEGSAPIFCGYFKNARRAERRMKQLVKDMHYKADRFRSKQWDYNKKTMMYDMTVIQDVNVSVSVSVSVSAQVPSTSEKPTHVEVPSVYILQHCEPDEEEEEEDEEEDGDGKEEEEDEAGGCNTIIEVTATFEAAVEAFKQFVDENDIDVEDLDAFSCAEYRYNNRTKNWEYVNTWQVAPALMAASDEDEDEDDEDDG